MLPKGVSTRKISTGSTTQVSVLTVDWWDAFPDNFALNLVLGFTRFTCAGSRPLALLIHKRGRRLLWRRQR